MPSAATQTNRPQRPGGPQSPPNAKRGKPRALGLRMTAGGFVLAVAIAAFFAWLTTWPLWHTDLWGHLAYGRLILQTHQLPATEPFMPLAGDVPIVDTAWLSQLVGYGALIGGLPGLHLLFAAAVTASLAILAFAIARRTGSAFFAFAGCLVCVAVRWELLQIIRPQLAGVICYTGLLSMLTARQWRARYWILVPFCFALWANLHGSFLVGLASIAIWCLGRAVDVAWRTKSIAAPLRDARTRRLFVTFVLAALAVLVNPYGWRLYAEVLSVTSNGNLAALVEWGPLTLRMRQGRMYALATIALMVAYRMSPRRISLGEAGLLIGLGLATLWSSRMIVWFAPVAGFYFALHASAVWRHWRGRHGMPVRQHDGSLWWTAAAIAACAAGVASMPVVASRRADGWPLRDNLSRSTPVVAAATLRDRGQVGQIFNTFEFGDFLIWIDGSKTRVFVASHAHLVPEPVWRDYLDVISLRNGWEATLDRYGVQTVVIDPIQHAALADALQQRGDWKQTYNDGIALIFDRAQ